MDVPRHGCATGSDLATDPRRARLDSQVVLAAAVVTKGGKGA
jgi:hypothetical protein